MFDGPFVGLITCEASVVLLGGIFYWREYDFARNNNQRSWHGHGVISLRIVLSRLGASFVALAIDASVFFFEGE